MSEKLRSLLFASLLAAGASFAQTEMEEVSDKASIVIFNALPDAAALVDWNGINAFPGGIGAGNSIGPIPVPVEDVSVIFTAEGFAAAKGSVNFSRGERRVIILWAGPPEKDRETGEEKPKIQVFTVPAAVAQIKRTKLEWPVVFLGPAQTALIEVNGQAVQLDKGKPSLVGQGAGFVEIKQGDRELAMASEDGPADYIFVVYGDDPSNLSGGVIYR
jgi:hypothetical protein